MVNLTSQWQVDPVLLPATFSRNCVVRYKNRLFCIGGFEPSSPTVTADIFSTVVHADGTMDQWQPAGSLPAIRLNHNVVVYRNKMYVIGGGTTNSAATNADTIFIGTIFEDGTVGAWVTSQIPRGGLGDFAACVTSGGYIYVLGGVGTDGNNVSDAWVSKIQGDGLLGPWSLLTSSAMPPASGLSSNAAVECNGYIVMVGGGDNTPTWQSAIYTAKIHPNGQLDPWKYVGDTTTARNSPSLVVFGDTVVVIGGTSDTSTTFLKFCEAFKVDTGGTISVPSVFASPLPIPVRAQWAGAVVINGIAYLVGGRTSSGYSNQVQEYSLKF